MRINEPRIQPLDPEQFTPAQTEVFAGQMKMGGGRLLNIFRTLANHEKLAKRWLVFGNHILSKNTIPAREREIAILRIGWLCQAEYEWGQHVVIGKREGLTDDEIEAIKTGPSAESWNDLDRLILQATDELKTDSFISDETWNGLCEYWSQEQLMDLVFTVGQYNLVSMALNSFGVQLDKGIPGF